MMSGAMMSVISFRELVTSMVGMMPRVVPLLGSTAVSGTGSTGQVVGLSQLISCRGLAALGVGGRIGPLTAGVGAGAGGEAAGASCDRDGRAARQSGTAAIRPS